MMIIVESEWLLQVTPYEQLSQATQVWHQVGHCRALGAHQLLPAARNLEHRNDECLTVAVGCLISNEWVNCQRVALATHPTIDLVLVDLTHPGNKSKDPTCYSCGRLGHYVSDTQCPNFGQPWMGAIQEAHDHNEVVHVSGDTPSDPFPSSSAATHRFPMSDPHCMSLSNLGPYCAYHGLHHITPHLCIYYVPTFLDLAYVWQLTWWLGTV